MLKRFLQGATRNLLESDLIHREVLTFLGPECAKEVQALKENRLQDVAGRKRAEGLVVLGRSIISTRSQLNDPDLHRYLWNDIAGPSIRFWFEGSKDPEYGPIRFYVDAIDYAAVMNMLPGFLMGGEPSAATRMVNTMHILNLKHLKTGGYFGRTPYLTLNTHRVWKDKNRTFSSAQVYWLILLIVDYLTVEIQMGWAQAIVDADLDEVKAFTDDQIARSYVTDLPLIAYMLCLGAVVQAATNRPGSSRSAALLQVVNSIGGDPMYVLQTLVTTDSMRSIQALKFLLDEDHPLQVLPDSNFALALRLQAATIKAFLSIKAIEQMIDLPEGQDVFTDARETIPHLLQLSL